MPNWKKVVTSGSLAELTAITMSGNIIPDSDNVHSLGASDNRFLLNGGTPVTVTGSGTANTITRFQGATTVEDSNIFSSDTLTRITHGSDTNDIFVVSGSNGEMFSITDEVGQKILRVNNDSGTEIFSVSSSGALIAPNLPESSSGLLLSYDNSTGDIKHVSASAIQFSTLSLANTTTDDTILLTSTENSSTAAPVFTFKRNSSSPADADYLGQLKFKGENDADQEVVYAKITAKIQDATDGTEDGLIEFSNVKAGSNNITARLKSDKLQLLNGTELEIDGEVSASGAITASNLNIADKTIYIDGDGDVNIGELMDQIDLIVDGNLVAGYLGDPYVIETNVSEAKVDINGKLRQLVSNTATGSITFADTTTFADNGRISYNQSNDEMSFWTNESKRTTINATGEVSSSAFVGDGSGLTGRAYRESISGATSYAITHSLNEDYPIVQVYSSSRAMVIPAEVITTSANAFDISFSTTFDGTVVVKK